MYLTICPCNYSVNSLRLHCHTPESWLWVVANSKEFPLGEGRMELLGSQLTKQYPNSGQASPEDGMQFPGGTWQ